MREPSPMYRRRCGQCAASRTSRSSSSPSGRRRPRRRSVGRAGGTARARRPDGRRPRRTARAPADDACASRRWPSSASRRSARSSARSYGVSTATGSTNLPAFVPPGHGLVYLAGLSLATLLARRSNALLVAAGAVAATWGIAGVTVLPMPDVSGTIGCAFLIGVLVWTRRPGLRRRLHGRRGARALRHRARHLDVAADGARVSVSRRGTRRAASRAGYVVFDILALTLVARLGLAAAAVQSRRGRRSAASTTAPARISSRAESTLPQTSQSRKPRGLAVAVDVGDDALAVRLGPLRDRVEARVDVADRLVAEVEQVGVEEREVVVRLAGAGHVGARRRGRACSRDPRARRASFRRARAPGSGRRRPRRRRRRARRRGRARRRRSRRPPRGRRLRRDPSRARSRGRRRSRPPRASVRSSSSRVSPTIPSTVSPASTVDALARGSSR